MSYADFLSKKRRIANATGQTCHERDVHPKLYKFQRAIVLWAVKKGRAALWCDCGLGKSFMQIEWARLLGQRTLFFAPLCVAEQTVAEAVKIGVEIRYARNAVEAIGAKMVITNYERIDDFDLREFDAVVLDESSILKSFIGVTRQKLIDACQSVKYRLCCTATPSPNDIAELANHAEFLGLCTRQEFLATWFIHDDAGWRMKKHAVQPFYRWLASWAIALRKPSDIGYDDAGFNLPKLIITDHILDLEGPMGSSLFPEMGARGLSGRLSARRASLEARTEAAAALAHALPDEQWLLWCGLNEESKAIAGRVAGAVEVCGNDTYAEKVAAVNGFTSGQIRAMVSKVRIVGYGMNFQNCHNVAFVGLGDSYEQYYQAIRRCWRFGQQHDVAAHVIISEAERVIVENVRRKEAAAADLATDLLIHMADFEREELAS